MHLNRQKAEEMCQTKLRKISKVKSKLAQTVLVRNTLKYVQSCEHLLFSFDHDDTENDDYEPFNKKLCKDISIADIDDILSEFDFSRECSDEESLKVNFNDIFIIETEYDTFDDNYDFVVPDNEVLEHLRDDDYFDYL